MTNTNKPVSVGVIGVGAMGRHHARVHTELRNVRLGGVTDVDDEQAACIAEEYGCEAYSLDQLLAEVDAVSIAVPTRYHYDVARRCIDAGVHLLVEKPFVVDPWEGRDLIDRAAEADVVLQVGHVERFNPAVRALDDILPELDVISVRADRLGPPPNRPVSENAIRDLMIHDIDVVLTLFDGQPTVLSAVGARDNTFATAMLQFPSEVLVMLTSSRVTQLRSRLLTITADDCFVSIDYMTKGIEIHRRAVPSLGVRGNTVSFRSESVIERPMIDTGEPLKAELAAFTDAVRHGTTPEVTGEDGLRALELALEVERLVTPAPRVGVQ